MSNVVINPYAAGGMPAPTFSFIFDATTSSIWTGDFARATTAAERAVGGDFVYQSSGTFRESHHDGAGVNLGALIEPARTNFNIRSYAFTQSPWGTTGGGTGSFALDATGIDGGTNKATTLEDTDVAGYTGKIYNFVDANAGALTYSLFCLKDAITTRFPEFQGGFNFNIGLNTSTGAVDFRNTVPSFGLSFDGNAWWQVVWGPQTVTNPIILILPALGLSLAAFDNAAIGSIVVGHFQVEIGEYATTPIETTGSAITRNADDASLSTVWPAGAWTAFFRGNIAQLSGDRVLFGSTSNVGDAIYIDSAGLLSINHGAGPTTTQTANAVTADTEFKAAISYDGADYELVLDAGTAASATSSRAFGGARQLGAKSDLSDALGGTCAQADWYDGVALSAAQMQALTT